MACFSDDAGKTWYCYGHRPDATRKEKHEQTLKTQQVEKSIQRRLERRRNPVVSVESTSDRGSVYGRRPKPIEEEDLSWAI
tara:strand:+ start:322 stop:564 length:243 start_codon:yes stop_codon:yes gene_type:complete